MNAMTARGRRQSAAALALVCWALAGASVVTLLTAHPAIDENLWYFVVDATEAAVYGTVAAVILSLFPELTDREREVLDLVARGYDNTTISRRLILSPKTVRNVVANVLSKLALPNRAAAIVRAREAGLGVD